MSARIAQATAVLITAAITIVGLSPSGCGTATPEKGVRVVLITLDTLRKDSLGDEPGSVGMPNATAFASGGQVFTSYFSATSSTQPSHASLFTGLHPWEHGVSRNGLVLTEEYRTLAEVLHAHGYETRAVVASFPLEARFGFDQGFDHYDDEFFVPDTVRTGKKRATRVRTWEGTRIDSDNFYSKADSITSRALRCLDQAKARNQFLWFHYFDPHAPYGDSTDRPITLGSLKELARTRSPELSDGLQDARKRYDYDVAYLDECLAPVFRRLQEDARLFETHVVVVSDHGESFGEHGALGHGDRVTRQQIEVPFFIVSPRLTPQVREDVVGTIDIPSTILSLVGIDAPELPGRDLTRERGESAVGMSRTYADSRRSGKRELPKRHRRRTRFYTARPGIVLTGDSTRVVEDDAPDNVPAADVEPVRALFATFSQELSKTTFFEVSDSRTQEALKALGYVR